jgi:hypothetical protein
VLGKEGVRPAIMVVTSFPSLLPLAAQDAAQAHPYPLVQGHKGGAMTMLEIPKPSLQGPAQVRHDGGQALPVGAPPLGANRVIELLQAFRTWPARTPFEMVE